MQFVLQISADVAPTQPGGVPDTLAEAVQTLLAPVRPESTLKATLAYLRVVPERQAFERALLACAQRLVAWTFWRSGLRPASTRCCLILSAVVIGIVALIGLVVSLDRSARLATELVDLSKLAGEMEKRGIKPIIGCEGYMVTDHKNDEKPGRENHKSYHIGMLAKTYEGYQNLSKVVSDAHVDGFYYRPRTDLETLAEFSEGLIGFTGCMQGWIPQLILRGEEKEAEKDKPNHVLGIVCARQHFVNGPPRPFFTGQVAGWWALPAHGAQRPARSARAERSISIVVARVTFPNSSAVCCWNFSCADLSAAAFSAAAFSTF